MILMSPAGAGAPDCTRGSKKGGAVKSGSGMVMIGDGRGDTTLGLATGNCCKGIGAVEGGVGENREMFS